MRCPPAAEPVAFVDAPGPAVPLALVDMASLGPAPPDGDVSTDDAPRLTAATSGSGCSPVRSCQCASEAGTRTVTGRDHVVAQSSDATGTAASTRCARS